MLSDNISIYFNISLQSINGEKINYNNFPLIEIIYLLSLSFEFLCLYVTFKAKMNLIKIEYYLLISMNLVFVSIKIKITLDEYLSKKNWSSSQYLCLFLYSLNFFNIQFYSILLFYSIFHLTCLKISPCLTFVKEKLQKIKFFLIYSVSIGFFSLLFHFLYGFYFRKKFFSSKNSTNNCYYYYNSTDKLTKLQVLLTFGIQTIFALMSLLNYGFCQMLLLKRILFKSNLIKKRKDKQNFRIIFKFFIFSFISSLSVFSVIFNFFKIFFVFDFLINMYDYLSKITIYFSLLNPLILIFVNDKLKQELIKIYKKGIFSNFK